ncbi:MAG: helix-turn-helix domain-containing protein [Fusicatenibacter saccharivorans]
MKTCKEMAKLWGVTERTVTTFCKTGKIPGAVKEGKSWRIPDEAEKPVDGRVLSGKYVKKEEKEARKPLPIGISGLRTGTVGILLCGQDRNDQRISGSKTTGITVYAAETIWKDVEYGYASRFL